MDINVNFIFLGTNPNFTHRESVDKKIGCLVSSLVEWKDMYGIFK